MLNAIRSLWWLLVVGILDGVQREEEKNSNVIIGIEKENAMHFDNKAKG